MAALALDSFCGIREALYGVFDGDKNVEVPNLLQCTMGDVLAEELHRNQREEDYMTSTFLTMQRYVHGYYSLGLFSVVEFYLVFTFFLVFVYNSLSRCGGPRATPSGPPGHTSKQSHFKCLTFRVKSAS